MSIGMPSIERTRLGINWCGAQLPPLPSNPHPVSRKLAEIACAGCSTPKVLASKPYILERVGIEPSTVSEAVVKEATMLFNRMEHRVEPDVRLFRQLSLGTVTQEADERVDSKDAPAPKLGKRKQTRASIFGYSITSVLRWMGKQGWNFEDASVVCATAGAASIADVTIRLQLKAGKDGLRGPAAPITPAQAKQLRKMAQ